MHAIMIACERQNTRSSEHTNSMVFLNRCRNYRAALGGTRYPQLQLEY